MIAFLVLIGVLITVHEFGHFAVAKLFGVKCEVFSIGFGRPLISFHRGETEYRLAWIPLGGYVRMLGQEPVEETNPDNVGRSLNDKSPFVRILIYAAGPAMNLLLPFAIIVPFVALSQSTAEVASTEVGAVDSSMPAYRAGLRGGDIIKTVDARPVHAFWQIKERLESYEPEQGPIKLQVERPGEGRLELSVTPQEVVRKHPLLGYARSDYLMGYQVSSLDSSIGVIAKDGPASQSGIRTFDRVLSIDGTPTKRFIDVLQSFRQLTANSIVKVEVERSTEAVLANVDVVRRKERIVLEYRATGSMPALVHASTCVSSVDPNGPANFLQRGDCIKSVDGKEYSLGAFLRSKVSDDPSKPKNLVWLRAGAEMSATLTARRELQTHPMAGDVPVWVEGFTLPRQAMVAAQLTQSQERWAHGWYRAKTEVPREIEVTTRSISGMFTGQVSPTQLGGPLTIFHLAGSAAQAGLDRFLKLMVLLSLSIGIFNLLPVPALDGGQIMIAGIEMITRRPLPERAQLALHQIGVFLILALIIFALSNDAIRTWRLSNS
ncbi:MAG: RIP metalloprotease RseP [Bradymonadia bacterium]